MAKGAEKLLIYEQVYRDLRNRIFSGRLRPGDMLPSENQLCTEYKASRETVRKGLKALNQEGLIFSRPKVGYFVSTPNHSELSITFNKKRDGFSSQYRDIHGILPDEEIQKILGIEPDHRVIEMSQITRNAESIIVELDVKFIPYERAYPSVESEMRYAVLPDITFDRVTSFEYYMDVQISAIAADEDLAQILECPAGEPLMLIERIFIRQDGRCIGYARQYSRSLSGKLCGTSGAVQKYGKKPS